jgi:hypothetical protein
MDTNDRHPTSFTLGTAPDARLEVAVTSRAHPGRADYWDGNWVNASVAICSGAFTGTYGATLRSEELVRFRDGLRALHRTLAGSVTFRTMERWLLIEIEGDGKGHFHARCVARDEAGRGNELAFELHFDQTDLPAALRGLDAICEAFPVLRSSP